jgi:hypothetical protein
MMPSVVPLLGSTAVSGTGSTGQVVGFSQLILCRGFAGAGLGAGMGPLTGGGGTGVAAGAAACGIAACAVTQTVAEAISASAARVRRLGLCLIDGGPPVSFESISTQSAALNRGLNVPGDGPRQFTIEGSQHG